MNSYRYSSDANADIEGIALYLFNLNPVAAHHFLNALEETCELLAGIRSLGGCVQNLAIVFVRFLLETTWFSTSLPRTV